MIAIGREYIPPAASVAYADAMSSGDTPIAPRPSEGTYAPSRVFSDERTPSLCAMSATFSGPTSRVSCAKTVLSERRVAECTDVEP